ncbi:MAG: hypothetical protein NC123_15570 [Butyrivibrio sp.]|nr:hypothetical protein [Acetatifactor muris]MCM1560938.1 hypothetical protein [Butyrivibrio sp.]
MPRVPLKKKEYMAADFAKWLIGEMRSRGLTQADMGELLGITQQAFNSRLTTHKFDIKEAIIIFHEWDTPPEKISQLLKY